MFAEADYFENIVQVFIIWQIRATFGDKYVYNDKGGEFGSNDFGITSHH